VDSTVSCIFWGAQLLAFSGSRRKDGVERGCIFAMHTADCDSFIFLLSNSSFIPSFPRFSGSLDSLHHHVNLIALDGQLKYLIILWCGYRLLLAGPRGVNLIWKLGVGVVGQGMKTGKLWVLMVRQTEARSTGLRVSSPEFLFNYAQIILFMKSPLWKVFSSHIPEHYVHYTI